MRPTRTSGRPLAPDARLLEQAARTLAERRGLPALPDWTVLQRQERRRSTLFRLSAVCAGVDVHAWAKVDAVDDGDAAAAERRLARFRESLLCELRVAPVLEDRFCHLGVGFDVPLAIDPEALAAVRLEVAGRPLGRAATYLRPGRQKRGLDLLARVGAALRAAEDAGATLGPSFDRPALHRRLDPYLQQARERLDVGVMAMLEDRIPSLVSAIDIEVAAVHAHGDPSPTNVLANGTQVGLIDFSWRPYLAGESVAHLAARLSCEPWVPDRWRRKARDALLSGYGRANVPSWHLSYLVRVLRWAVKPDSPTSRWARDELDRLLATSTA